MKKKALFLLFLLVGLVWTESIRATGKITFRTSRTAGESIEMNLKALGDIKIDGVNEPGKQGYAGYTLTSSEVVIEGDITFFACNDNDLTELDVSQCATLDTMQVIFNYLTSLDLSQNKKLRKVFCYENMLETLTLGNLPELGELLCQTNKLKNINLLGLPKLKKCWVSENPITNIDLSANKELEEFFSDFSGLKSLNISQNTKLKRLNVGYTDIQALDLSACPNLELLYCGDRGRMNVDVSVCSKLKEYAFFKNHCTEADFSGNPDIRYIECYQNDFTAAKMSKLVSSLPARQPADNAMLVVINTADESENNVCTKATVKAAQGKGWKVMDYAKGAYSAYEGSEDNEEQPEGSYVKVKTSKPAGTELTFYATALTPIEVVGAEVVKSVATTLTLKVVQPEIIIKGEMMTFAAQNAGITEAEVDNKVMLSLWLDNNEMTKLDLRNAETLLVLNVEKNKLKSLDVSSLGTLEKLVCGNNLIETLDLANNVNLQGVQCENNKLGTLDVSKNPNIGLIKCYGNNIGVDAAKAFFEGLPECKNFVIEDRGVICFINKGDANEKNRAWSQDVRKGVGKKFMVLDYANGEYGTYGKTYEGMDNPDALKLYVGGVMVTEDNAGDVLGDGGKVVYDMENKVLTLNNANITAIEGSAGLANSSVEGLTIRLVGTNTVSSQGNYVGFGMSKKTTITGDGKLILNGGSAGIYLNKSQLVIAHCTVEANGQVGIVGYDGASGEEITVDDATLKVNGVKGAAFFLTRFNTVGCHFPDNVYFSEQERAVVNADGTLFMGEFTIVPDVNGVGKTAVSDVDAGPVVVFGLNGCRRNELGRGLNIVKSADGKTRKVLVE